MPSIAASFRAKWNAIMTASDDTRGQNVDARYSAMAKAADDAGLILTHKDVIAAYQRKIVELENR